MAAPGVTAFDLLPLHQAQSKRRKTTPIGCSAIDQILNGGLESGRVCCIHGDRAAGKTSMALQFIASHLLTSLSDMAIIDTTGAFDVVQLHQVLLLRAGQSRADDLLHRVRIMRVFDFAGVVECVHEIHTELAQPTISPSKPPPVVSLPPVRKSKRRETMVLDSEDEDDDSDEPEQTPNLDPDPEPPSLHSSEAPSLEHGMLIIDNIASVTLPVMRSNHVQGNALLVKLLLSLSELSKSYNLTTLILNSVSHNRHRPKTPKSPVHDDNQSAEPLGPSIFQSNRFRPSMGKIIPHYCDLHLLLSCVPRTDRDAQNLQARQSGKVAVDLNPPQLVNVVEVWIDVRNGKSGQWAAFTIDQGVKITPIT